MNQVNQTKINNILANVTKRFGKESMMKLDSKRNLDIPNIPSQIMSLDLALGIGGLPKGRIVEFFGDGSSGKCLTSETLTNLLVDEKFYQYLKSKGFIEDEE